MRPEHHEAIAAAGIDLLAELQVGIGMVDPDGVTTFANRRLANMLSIEPAEMVGRPLLDFFDPADHQLVLAHVSSRRKGLRDEYDARLRRPDGSSVPARVHGSPLLVDGVFVGAMAAITDLSDLSEAASVRDSALLVAENSSVTSARFISWMSHELRTPLNAIAGFAQLLEADLVQPAQRSMAHSIVAASDHVNGLVQDMLDYSKAHADVLEPNIIEVSLAEVVHDAVELVSGVAHDRDVEINIDISDVVVLADRRHLVQVVVNLLSNAVKYGGRSTHVHVCAAVAGESARCSIIDEGPGIPLAEQRRVFEPFERLDTVGEVPGAGLGLAIASSFMRAMGGGIELDSTPGQGSTFTVVVPMAAGASKPGMSADPTSAGSRLIIYVEDEAFNATLVESIVDLLPGRSLHVEPTAAGGIEAILQLRPALILLDLHLADGSGFDVLHAVRNEPTLARTPLFILSADASDQAARRAAELGADRFITKPFNLKEFIALLERFS
jgi:PAS domain S-box-containing protein